LACWGWRALWVLKFPLAYLVVFAVPWGDAMVGPLQDITARIAVHALNLTGVPVLMNGRELVTPSAIWMVEQACSGVKFFIACSALGCLYAYLMYQRWWKRVFFVVLAAVVPIVANGLRVYFTILIGEAFGMKYATGTDHLVFGWQFFGTVLVLLLVVGWFFRDHIVVREAPEGFGDRPRPGRRLLWFATIALLIVGPAVAAGFAPTAAPETVSLSAPALSGWEGPESAGNDWRPSFHGAAGQVHVSYRSPAGAGPFDLFHAVYTGKPRDGHNLITYGNNVYDPDRSRVLSTGSQRVDLAGGRSVVAGELRLAGAAGTRLVWYWYCVDRRCTRSPVMIKLLQAWDVLRGHLPKSSVWALSSPLTSNGVDKARTELRGLAQAVSAADGMDSPRPRFSAAAGSGP
jgi:EpsI family protein